MAARQTSPKIHNLLLNALPDADRALVGRSLEAVDLPLRLQLEQRNRLAAHVYFPESGIASVVVRGPRGQDIEGGIIGRDGMTGLATVLGADRSAHDIMIQLAGEGQRMPVAAFAAALRESRAFDLACRRYVYAFLVQTSYTALANGRNNIEERLARWLLMAQDRTDTQELDFTHEFLALMLGVRRAGVTLAISLLTGAGLILHARGRIAIIDRPGLVAITKGSYGPAEEHLERLSPKKPLLTAA